MIDKVFKIKELKLTRNPSNNNWSLGDKEVDSNIQFCCSSEKKLAFNFNNTIILEHIRPELKVLSNNFKKLEKSIKDDPFNDQGKTLQNFNISLNFLVEKTRTLSSNKLNHLCLSNYISGFFFSEYSLLEVNGITYKTSKDPRGEYCFINLEPL
jgi:hypothetical protein